MTEPLPASPAGELRPEVTVSSRGRATNATVTSLPKSGGRDGANNRQLQLFPPAHWRLIAPENFSPDSCAGCGEKLQPRTRMCFRCWELEEVAPDIPAFVVRAGLRPERPADAALIRRARGLAISGLRGEAALARARAEADRRANPR
jgi:hypothetical protein